MAWEPLGADFAALAAASFRLVRSGRCRRPSLTGLLFQIQIQLPGDRRRRRLFAALAKHIPRQRGELPGHHCQILLKVGDALLLGGFQFRHAPLYNRAKHRARKM